MAMLDEQLSALLDGELGPDEAARVLERIKREPALRAAWSRQHLLRAALRSQLTGEADLAFADRLMDRIQSETAPSKVVHLSTARALPATVAAPAMTANPNALRRWGVGFALAAGLALAAVAISPLNPLSSDEAGVTVAATEANWTAVNEETARELNDYLLDHHNAAAGYGFSTTSGYARLAAPGSQYVAFDPNE
ncbi:MAG: sigma-E factor negative regulatory protein [Nevskiales bacterium]